MLNEDSEGNIVERFFWQTGHYHLITMYDSRELFLGGNMLSFFFIYREQQHSLIAQEKK